jgi:CcmD family protein
MTDLLPLAIVAVLVWAGVFAYIFAVDRKIAAIEQRIEDRQRGVGDDRGDDV